MKKNLKYISIFVLMFSFMFFLSSCDSGSSSSSDTIATTVYNLNAQTAGIGTITDIDSGEVLTGDQNSMYSDRYLRDDRIRLRAEGAGNSEFLFWADNNVGNIYNPRQDITMNSNKSVMAVFGGEEVFLAGYIHENIQNKNVIGFWKTLNDFPHLEIYVRDTRYATERYRYFLDAENRQEDHRDNAIVKSDQGADSEFIAAIYRIEEPEDDLDYTKILFVYADVLTFRAVVLDSQITENENLFDEAYEKKDSTDEFITFVRQVIHENRNKDIILGSTEWPYYDINN